MVDKISKLLQNNNILKVLSFLIAFLSFLVISQSGSPWWRDLFQQTQIVDNVVVTTQYDSEQYYVTGIPSKMPISISGNENQIIAAKNQASGMHVVIDLTGYEPGQYTISSKNMRFDVPSGIKASSVIGEFNIDIQKKAVQDFPITLTYSDASKQEGFTFSTPTLSQSSVTISGGAQTLNSIANVQALVDLSGIDVTKGDGSAEIEANLVAYSKDGLPVENVTLSVDKIKVSIEYKSQVIELPVDYQISGQGELYVASICPVDNPENCGSGEQPTVKVFGNDESIKQLTSQGKVTYSLDLSQLDKNQGQVPGVALVPQGVYAVGGNSRQFDVKLEKGVTKTITDVSIQTDGLDPSLSIKAVSAKDGKVSVTVTGAESLINGYTDADGNQVPGISAGDIGAYLDLSKITEPGSYDVPILINKNKPFTYTLSSQTIKITVVEAS